MASEDGRDRFSPQKDGPGAAEGTPVDTKNPAVTGRGKARQQDPPKQTDGGGKRGPGADLKMFKAEQSPDWCPGCGDFGILTSVQMALAESGRSPHEVAVFTGIGCSGKTNQYIRAYGIHTLHGRVLPFATGAKLANPHLEVLAIGGDGDGYGIGAGHFLNAGRRNLDMAYIVFNNGVYALTKGQASPTLPRGAQTKSLPLPNINEGVNPIALAISAGYTWVGRGYAFDVKGLVRLIQAAMDHKGAALLDILQPCPTYNNVQDRAFYTPRIKPLPEDYDGRVQDPEDEEEVLQKQMQAIQMGARWGDAIPTGVLYEVRAPTLEERVAERVPEYPQRFPADGSWVKDGRPTSDLTPYFEELRVGPSM